MSINIAYCEDEAVQLEYMNTLLQNWAAQRKVSCTYYAYGSAKELLFEHPDNFPFDVLFLDIDMDGINGMELAKKIRMKDKKLPIVFLTNRKEYVFEGYEVGAMRYLLKPLEEEKLFGLLDAVAGTLEKQTHYLIAVISGETVKIDVDTILSVEAKGHYICLHTCDGDYEYKKNFSEITEELTQTFPENENKFISTHRSFFVNLAAVERVLKAECILSDGSSIPISRNSYKNVNEAFIRYYIKRQEPL